MSIDVIDESNVIAEFNVVSLNNSYARPLRTFVSHLVSTEGGHDVVRIEQEGYCEDDDNDVVILTRQDFDRIANILKGH